MLWKGFQKPKRLASDATGLTDKYGMFWAQPFERGFGTTIGNALRRVLLSSIEGAAVTAVKIEGVLHEFQSIPGVVEDATDIILNLKQIPFKLAGEGPKAIYLRADQPGVVTSGMIEADGDVEVLDKEIYIATVSEGGKLDMEMRLKRGRGYVSADKNFEDDLGIGFIPIDSVHSPVRKCNYTVEAARLGQSRRHRRSRRAVPSPQRAERPGRVRPQRTVRQSESPALDRQHRQRGRDPHSKRPRRDTHAQRRAADERARERRKHHGAALERAAQRHAQPGARTDLGDAAAHAVEQLHDGRPSTRSAGRVWLLRL
jgi:hypothetical protein